jgi:hypothetical protein
MYCLVSEQINKNFLHPMLSAAEGSNLGFDEVDASDVGRVVSDAAFWHYIRV